MVKNKSVFITGVSSGFGFLTTKKLIENGYVIVAALRGGEARGRELFKSYVDYIDEKKLFFWM
jgi:NAD(P)-dependent dehydrogenase (short-subunit alcohol dehydrogenase family)